MSRAACEHGAPLIFECPDCEAVVSKPRKAGCTPFNINSYVYVRLTSRARAALRKEYYDFWERHRGVSVPSDYKPHTYVEPSVDADGYSGFQLWKFMEAFGPILNMSTELSVWFEDGAVIQVQTGG